MDIAASPLGRQLRPQAEKVCKAKGWPLGEFLGAGASAAVYEVTTEKGLRALKLFSPQFLKGKRGELLRRRLDLVLKELQNHSCPSLIQIDEGGDCEGAVYLLMACAPGRCLGEILKLVPPGDIRSIVQQVAEAAKFLEDKKLCHRDIKSDNIVVSNDFKTATLLDLGVVRWLDEEGAAGTDDDGQLPFVATARYSSPEYMFRLTPSGPDLWRGLTFYQLGGLLHDLIMKDRLFEEIIKKSAENRYLIAYAVATAIPNLRNDGSVPLDLVLLAQRALEKDLTKRLASVDWEDFFGANTQRQNEVILGLRSGTTKVQAASQSKVPDWARDLDDALDRRLIEASIDCKHEPRTITADRAVVELAWNPRATPLPEGSRIQIRIELVQSGPRLGMEACGELHLPNDRLIKSEGPKTVSLSAELEEMPASLTDHAYDAFVELSADLVRAHANIPRDAE